MVRTSFRVDLPSLHSYPDDGAKISRRFAWYCNISWLHFLSIPLPHSASAFYLWTLTTYITFTGTVSSSATSEEPKLKGNVCGIDMCPIRAEGALVWFATYFFSLLWQLAIIQTVTALLAWSLEWGEHGAESTVNSWWTCNMREKWNLVS